MVNGVLSLKKTNPPNALCKLIDSVTIPSERDARAWMPSAPPPQGLIHPAPILGGLHRYVSVVPDIDRVF
jgi:hypothetical protein